MSSTTRLMLLWISPLVFGAIVALVARFVMGTDWTTAGLVFLAGFVFDHGLHRLVFGAMMKNTD